MKKFEEFSLNEENVTISKIEKKLKSFNEDLLQMKSDFNSIKDLAYFDHEQILDNLERARILLSKISDLI
jgi:molecular chaperone GrpE (heat shock protein)